jgi:hypothetical protein
MRQNKCALTHYKSQQDGKRREFKSQHTERQQPHDNKKPLQSGTVHQSQMPIRIDILARLFAGASPHAPYQ